MEQKIRWGVLGTGRIVGKAGAALQQSKNGIWLGVAGRNGENSRAASALHGVPRAYSCYEDLLADPDIDAVYIALLNHLHYEWAVKACEAGKHVLVEKPFALNVSEAQEMTDAARIHGVQIKEAHVWRYYEGIAEIRKMLQDGTIGEWVHFRGHFSFLPDKSSTRWNAAWGGGALYDVGCYLVAWARYFAGEEPEAVEGHAWSHPEHAVDERFVGTLYFPLGRTAQLGAYFNMPHGSFFEVLGTQGKLRVDLRAAPEALNLICTSDRGVRTWSMNRVEPFRRQAEHFADTVMSGGSGSLHPDAEDTMKQALIMDALFKSAEKGRRIQL